MGGGGGGEIIRGTSGHESFETRNFKRLLVGLSQKES